MTIQDFITKAIEGWWEPEDPTMLMQNIKFLPTGMRFYLTGHERAGIYYAYAEVFLDPEAWKAVGKVEGWQEPDFYDTKPTKAYLARMHRMIDALAEGKSVEDFLATI